MLYCSCPQALREFARVQPEELPALDGVDLHVCVKDQALLCTDVAKGAQDSDANSNPMIQACLKENYGKLEDNACKSEMCVSICVVVLSWLALGR